ncbi:hypothetical protein [Pontibacillus litoralis]|uniref:Uncharacterized protein n=1 Tax=Pontibacillus litoralis JSM 072002 TaxID=1385512 RepID=A0A0A5G8E2_9BACI|nr:hypothetical protein [Pontibacillus litoralis]KGX87390.1 hypothetical protein N784_15515 [Pontibacillus litoralis JSM 072002]
MKNIHAFMIKLLLTILLIYYGYMYVTNRAGGIIHLILGLTYSIWVINDIVKHQRNQSWLESYSFFSKHHK